MAKTGVFGPLLALLGTLQLAACSGSSDETAKNGLPSSFGDCDADVCEVQLGAFTKNPGSIPYCPPKQADLDLSCAAGADPRVGTCAELYAVSFVYGFPGDSYECVYQAGTLVGARWTPDSHKPQFAGTQLPSSCELEPLCSPASDAGTD